MLFDRLSSGWSAYRQHLAPLRALVVDDKTICLILSEILSDEGFEVTTILTAEDAWSKIESETFDLLVVDKNLPKMSGLELLALIAEAEIDLPAVMITAFASRESVNAALRSGAADYIAKPFADLAHVVRRLKAVVERRAADTLYDRIVSDLKNALTDAVADKDELKPVARELFIFKKELAERPDTLVLSADLAVGQVMSSAVGRLGLAVEQATTLEAASARLGESPSPLTIVTSLELPGVVELIARTRREDPLLEVLVVSPDPNLALSLQALAAGATDFVDLGVEGRSVLMVRVKRLVHAARRQRLQVHLITTLYRWLAAQNHPAAHDLRAILPERERAFLDQAAGPLPERAIDEAMPELIELLEDAPVPAAVLAIPHVAPPVALHAAARAADRMAGGTDDVVPIDASGAVRAHPRQPVDLKILYLTPDSQGRRPARTLNVSRNGMFVVTDQYIALGTRLAIHVMVPHGPGSAPVVAEGEVVHYGSAAPGAEESFGLGIRIFEAPGSPYDKMVAALEEENPINS